MSGLILFLPMLDSKSSPPPYTLGTAVGAIIILWNVLFVRIALTSNFPNFFKVWQFSAIVSLFMILPDWFLAEGLGVLEFPDNGAF